MRSCKMCGKEMKVGFWDRLFGDGFCERCSKAFSEWGEKYTENSQAAGTDPKACAWLSVCNLLCAQRFGVARPAFPDDPNRERKTDAVRTANKLQALEFAQKGLSLVSEGSPGESLLRGIAAKAEQLETSGETRRAATSDTLRPAMMLGFSPSNVELGIYGAGVMAQDVVDAIKDLPGHEWLLSKQTS